MPDRFLLNQFGRSGVLRAGRVILFVLAGVGLVFSGLLIVQVVLGSIVGLLERWPWGDSLYFTFVTGLTILSALLMLGVEPTGYAAEEEMPTLSSELFVEPTTQAPKSEAEPQAPVAPRPGAF